MIDNIDDNYYCKPILAKSSFNENYKYYESRGDKDKKLLIEQHLDMFKPYLSDLINENKTIETSSNEWNIQINMHINFVSSNDTGEIRTVFVWSDNEEIRLGNETDDIFKRLINSFFNNYQKEEIILRNESNFVFESVGLLSYHIHKTSLKRGNSYIKSPEWIASKKAIINPKNKDDRCFEYSIVVALRHMEIKSHPERIQGNHHLFSCDYNWQGIDFPAGIKEWKRFEKNNETIALNILQVPHDEIKITHAYKSKYNHTRKNQVVLLMITDGEKWHYTALKSEPTEDGFNRPTKSLPKLFRGITSNHKSCQNNPNESYTEQNVIHEPCGYSLNLVCSFYSREDKNSFYSQNDCIKKFCSELKEVRNKSSWLWTKRNDAIKRWWK